MPNYYQHNGTSYVHVSDYAAIEARLAEVEAEHAAFSNNVEQCEAENDALRTRLVAAEQTLKAHGIHVEEKWCWCGPTVEKYDE